jgi:glutathione S-transferase
MAAPKLTYFNIEGAAEKIRLTFALSGAEFVDERIDFEAWPELKKKLPGGQLPIIELPDGRVLTQSMAMAKWAAAKYDASKTLYPVDDPDKLFVVEEALGIVEDLQQSWKPSQYVGMRPEMLGHPAGADWDPEQKAAKVKEMREKFLAQSLPNHLDNLAKHIEKNGGGFLCGSSLTLADLQLLTQLRYFSNGIADHIPADCLEQSPAITAYLGRVYEVPQIKAWYKM